MATLSLVRDRTDLAHWMALCRAIESERADALFRDPFARRLAGERGEWLGRQMRSRRYASAEVVTRTAVFDQMVLDCVTRGGTDAVLNLGAGFDTRPYRLPLPPTLRWVEVDRPEALDEKGELLGDARATCRVESVGLDLSDRPARRAVFAHVARSARCVLVLTEELLTALSATEVAALATDLASVPRLDRWIAVLLLSEGLADLVRGRAASAQLACAQVSGGAFFRASGWAATDWRASVAESRRLARLTWPVCIIRAITRLVAHARGTPTSAEPTYVTFERDTPELSPSE